MSLLPTLHRELSSQVPKAPEPVAAADPLTSSSSARASNTNTDHGQDTHGDSAEQQGSIPGPGPESEQAQQVFEQAPLPETSRVRQLTVTTLIVLSNLVQVCRRNMI